MDLNSLKKTDDTIVADSIKVINKILSFSDLKPIELHIREDLQDLLPIDQFEKINILSREEIKAIKGEKFHKGAIASFSSPKVFDQQGIESPFVILNGVTSPENVGSIVRTIAGLGFKSLVIDEKSCSPLVRRAIRVSMGNIIFLKVHHISDLKDYLKSTPFKVYATANESDSINLYDWEPSNECGFIIGSEGHGIDKEIFPLCHATLRIPISENVHHLNAAQACAITASWIHSKNLLLDR